MTSLTTDHAFLDPLLDEHDAVVAVGDRTDGHQQYLTRFHGPDRPYAFVYDGEATLCAPALFAEQARREFGGRVVPATAHEATHPAVRAAALLPDGSAVAVPSTVASEHVTRLDGEGLAVETVDPAPLERARRRKSAAERDRHRTVQTAAQAGLRRGEAVLAASEPSGDRLRWEGAPLTTERLRREVNATLARHGVTDAGNTVIGAGSTCADLHFTGEDAVRPGETVLFDASPRGPEGYYGDCSRTFVAGPVGTWERRAYDAVDAALDAALDALAAGAGVEGATVRSAVEETLAAHGVEDIGAGMTHGPGHGVGLSLHESPTYDGPLRAGDVVTVEPGVYHPERGGVRLEDLVVVHETGIDSLGEYPRRIEPRAG